MRRCRAPQGRSLKFQAVFKALCHMLSPSIEGGFTNVLPCKSKAWYQSAQSGERALVEIINVHYDDLQPYYTIHLADGVERSTVRSRLTPCTDEELESEAAAKAKAKAQEDARAAAERSQDDALLEAIAALGGPLTEEEEYKYHPRAKENAKKGSTPRGASPARRRKPPPPAASNPPPAATPTEFGDCMVCKGKRKSIYQQCEECARHGVAEYRRILCNSCKRTCETCGFMTLCPTCKRDVHTTCRRCNSLCRRRDYNKSCQALGKEACCKCKCISA